MKIIMFLITVLLSAAVGAADSISPIPTENTVNYKHGSRMHSSAQLSQSYYEVRLTNFSLSSADSKRWWKGYTPVVVIKLDDGRHQITRAIGGIEEIGGKNIRFGSSKFNEPVAGPWPYEGGNVKLSVVLYAVKSKNRANDIISVIDSVTSAVPIGNLAAYVPVARQISSAIDQHILKDEIEKRRVSIAWQPWDSQNPPGSPFKSGYFIVHDGSINVDDIHVQQNANVRIVTERGEGNQPAKMDDLRDKDATYAVVEITYNTQRQDSVNWPYYGPLQSAINAADQLPPDSKIQDAEAIHKRFDDAMAILFEDPNFSFLDKRIVHDEALCQLYDSLSPVIDGYSSHRSPIMSRRINVLKGDEGASLILHEKDGRGSKGCGGNLRALLTAYKESLNRITEDESAQLSMNVQDLGDAVVVSESQIRSWLESGEVSEPSLMIELNTLLSPDDFDVAVQNPEPIDPDTDVLP